MLQEMHKLKVYATKDAQSPNRKLCYKRERFPSMNLSISLTDPSSRRESVLQPLVAMLTDRDR